MSLPRHAEESKPLVLVVDDEPMMRWFMATALRDTCRVLVAADGEEALLMLRAAGEPVAAVITDIQMPRLDGLGLAARLREVPEPPPILFVTGFGGGGEIRGPLLAKPFGPDALVAGVRDLLAAQAEG
jgi:CheY-like chemotaxis protein